MTKEAFISWVAAGCPHQLQKFPSNVCPQFLQIWLIVLAVGQFFCSGRDLASLFAAASLCNAEGLVQADISNIFSCIC
jgi:hypothetical protein